MSVQTAVGHSRIVANKKTRHGIVIAHCCEHKITSIKNEQDAQIPSDAAFVKSAKRTNADAGMDVCMAKNFRQPPNGGVDGSLLR